MSTDYDAVQVSPFQNTWFWRQAESRLHSQVVAVTAVCGSDFLDGVNHWRIFCAFDDGRSVCLDMVKAEAGQLGGYLGVLQKQYQVTHSAFATYPMDLRATPFTLYDLLNALHTRGTLRYNYASRHEGCRHWVRTAITVLENAGLLVQPSAATIQHYVKFVWTSATEFHEREVGEGTFY
ncbi:hypothetical protein BV25DRAFT_1830705 [Artomyces pyxidatus]|uniref:Uncharacterized protein n=1 Tax=Artomyces pyxidatus TaxID=48021 RepID=A0ACB8SPG6_9AGAM|nr:hypothetical protein BV25DRAFT_1830705 [Artomyces pyxidatus]